MMLKAGNEKLLQTSQKLYTIGAKKDLRNICLLSKMGRLKLCLSVLFLCIAF